MVLAGPTNSLLDVAGLHVGQSTRTGDGWLTGTTVVLAPPEGMTAGVDVRGGGPGTRETDLLDPRASVEQIHAIVLTGGSAYGLAAADGVAQELGHRGIGLLVGSAADEVVPIVPAAVLFDLGRGGEFARRAGAQEGRDALAHALTGEPILQGGVGAGTGALSGGLKGAIGTASATLPGGGIVAALVAVNSYGSPVDERTGELLGARNLLAGDAPALTRPAAGELDAWSQSRAALRMPTSPTQNTTIGVVATDLRLSKAQCAKLAGVGHDGLARAIDPVHALFDGDTLFAVSTGGEPTPDTATLMELHRLAAATVTRAIVRGLLAAETVRTPAGVWSAYRDVFSTALR